jgi:hypothetical protein
MSHSLWDCFLWKVTNEKRKKEALSIEQNVEALRKAYIQDSKLRNAVWGKLDLMSGFFDIVCNLRVYRSRVYRYTHTFT